MERAREAQDRLRHQRASRLRVLRAQLPQLVAAHERAVARESRHAAPIATRLRHAEATLAALDRLDAAEATVEKGEEPQP